MLDFLNIWEKHFLVFLGNVFTDPIAFSLAKSCCETLYMVLFSTFFAVIFGLPLGVLLSVIKPSGIMATPSLYRILSAIVNVVRSFPFIVLIFLLLPLSKLLIGTSIGSTAAIIPLVIAATPFIARLFEGAFDEVDKGLVEATMSMGASKKVVIFMMISESLPSIINAITITSVSLVGFSAMAGVVGAGGLGDLAYRIGFQSFKPDVLTYAVICIIVMVQCIQSSGDLFVKRLRQYR
ncbi:methionine ABC transporter permease [uncultured Helicobacter sp.]|uniref:methionine ABC transporter permease n=1 Tax=uncultured Helicobacter sp. TaxID=175537 RepID=UPI0025E30EE2|nr:methionine ABC transporter permease [uncultured Helicobacter sp.]